MKNQEQKYNKLRRQKINLMLNEEERRLITEKAIEYGFGDCLAEYIRAAAIYENIYIEDIEGKTEICDIVSSFIEMLKKILTEQKKVIKNVLLSKEDVDLISNQNQKIIEMIESLSRLVVSILSVNTEKKIQQRKNALEKYRIDGAFLKKIISEDKNVLVVRPSNLHVPNKEVNFFVYLTKYNYTFDLANMDVNEFVILVNHFRTIAMQKKLLIAFVKDGKSLQVGIAVDFTDYAKAEEYAIDIEDEKVIVLLDKNQEIVGDHYSNDK